MNTDILKNHHLQLGVAIFASFAVGLVVGRKVTVTAVQEEAREIINKEILEARKYYAQLNEREKAMRAPDLVMAETTTVVKQEYPDGAAQTMIDYGSTFAPVDDETLNKLKTKLESGGTLSVTRNVWDVNEGTKLEVEVPEDTSKPYLIHKEDFLENENGYSQVTTTYYAADSVLVGEDDEPVKLELIGENLDKFGRGTNEDQVMYIRNEPLELDIEVIQHFGSYSKVILGLDDDNPSG